MLNRKSHYPVVCVNQVGVYVVPVIIAVCIDPPDERINFIVREDTLDDLVLSQKQGGCKGVSFLACLCIMPPQTCLLEDLFIIQGQPNPQTARMDRLHIRSNVRVCD